MGAPMRRSGILLHPTSLPGPGPCGDLGEGALRFLDWLHVAGCSLWQMLPTCPPGGGFSPYISPAARAGGVHLVSVDLLVADGLLGKDEVYPRPRTLGRVDTDAVERWHDPLVLRAGGRLAKRDPAAVAAFVAQNPWVEDYAMFRVLARSVDGGWPAFPAPLRDRQPAALDRLRETHDGRLYDPRFGLRGRGEGAHAAAIGALFEASARRLGLSTDLLPFPEPSPFRRRGAQLGLFP